MVGFIRAFDRVEIVVTLARSCIDPMIPHHEKFIIKSTFTDIPYTQWAETSPKPMLRNVAKLAEVKLDFELRPKKSTKTPDEGTQSKELLDTLNEDSYSIKQIQDLKEVAISENVEEEYKTVHEKKDDTDNNNTKHYVGNLSLSQARAKNPSQFPSFSVAVVGLIVAFGLGRMTTINGSNFTT